MCPVLRCSGTHVSHLGLFLPLKGLLKLLTVQLYDFAVVEDVRESASFPLLFLGSDLFSNFLTFLFYFLKMSF